MALESKIKHLEFIQNVITRMNSNSFLIKGWAVTLISALFALAAKDANLKYAMISFVAVPAFWVLDGFFIAVERRYRALYKHVITIDESNIDFSMDASSYAKDADKTWVAGIFSQTILPFYGFLIVIVVLVMYFMGA